MTLVGFSELETQESEYQPRNPKLDLGCFLSDPAITQGVMEMKLSFRKSGGFAPIFQGCQFDTEANPKDADTVQLEILVRASGIMAEKSKKNPAARDVFYYTFDIELNGQKNKVTFDQLSVPPKVKPLVEFLLERAKNMLPD